MFPPPSSVAVAKFWQNERQNNMVFNQEPQRTLGNKVGVLLMNLGTPNSTATQDVRTYLKEFLSDQRVVELPSALWQPILRGAVLTRRPKESAANYRKVWTEQGSPLAVIVQQQAAVVQAYFQQLGADVTVTHAMTYGEPSVAKQMETFKAQGIGRVLVLPLYPQYSGSATAAALDKVYADLLKQRNQPSLRVLSRYGTHAGYISAMSHHVRTHLTDLHQYDQILFSYHGIPQNHVDAGDPYYEECMETSHLLAAHLGLQDAQYTVAFQSRFGKAKWVGPSTQDILQQWPRDGIRNIAVFCPGFSADCLETLEEIAISGKELFQDAGGERYDYLPCVNTEPAWMDALCLMVAQELSGWI